ncbi:MAG: four helix bundle protein, partial [Bacteroidota bacterium]
MTTFKRFEEIEAWRLARELENKIWKCSNDGTFGKDYGLKNQINRSTGSVMDNIAEGFGRGGNKEFIQFLCISRASNDEVRSQ